MNTRRHPARLPTPKRWAAAYWVLLVTLGPWVRSALADPSATDLAWQVPPQVRLVRWPETRALADSRLVPDPSKPVALGPKDVLLVPAASGALVRVEGTHVEVGLGSGTGVLPDAITWLPARGGESHVLVPTWSMSRFLAVRAARGTPTLVRVSVATLPDNAMAEYRADEQVAKWLFDGALMPHFPGPVAGLNARIRFIRLAKDALADLSRTPAGTAWLQARWLELGVSDRTVRFPFVADAQVRVRGGRPMPSPEAMADDPDGKLEQRLLRPGERLVIDSDAADMVTLLLRARAVGKCDVRIVAGASPHQRFTVTVPRRAGDPQRWTPARLVRAPLAPGQAVAVEVLRGQIWASIRGYRQRPSTFAAHHARNRSELLRRAQEWLDEPGRADKAPGLRWLRALVRLAWVKSREATQEFATLAADSALTSAERALSLHELLAHGDWEAKKTGELLVGLWEATQRLAEPERLIFRRSALESLADSRFGPLDPPLGPALEDTAASPRAMLRADRTATDLAEERVRFALAREVVDPPRDGAPSVVGLVGERLAMSFPQRLDLVQRAHRVWVDATSWVAQESELDSRAITRVEPVFDAAPGEQCPTLGPAGLRWLRIGPKPRQVQVTPGKGTHVRVLVRGVNDASRVDSSLLVDTVPVTVHSASGLGSTVAVAPGSRTWRVTEGPPVMARVALEGNVPCDELYETERWVPVEGWTRFDLPDSDIETVASVIFDPHSLDAGARTVAVRVSDRTSEGVVRWPASGVLEVLVPAGVKTLSVRADERVLVRVRVRLHPSAGAPRRLRSPQPPIVAREADLLERIVRITRRLRSTTRPSDRAPLWLERATILDELSYARLARADRERAASHGARVDAPPPEPGSLADFELPAESGPIVPIGHVPKIPTLTAPSRHQALERALARKANGALPNAVLDALGSSADNSAGPDALLLALAASETGDPARAASALERIGMARPSAEALAWAAELYTDAASANPNGRFALKAYLVARNAARAGAVPGMALARLEPALRWQDLWPESAAGASWVEELWLDSDEPPLGDRLRRALLDAPEGARLLGAQPRVIGLANVAGAPMSLTLDCHALDGAHEGCSYALSVDYHAIACDAAQSSTLDDDVARPKECHFTPPPEARRLVITPPPNNETLGWVVARRHFEGSALPLSTSGQWWEVNEATPLRFTVRGPTVLRLMGRSEPNVAGTLEVRGARAGERNLPVLATLVLDQRPDLLAWRKAGRSPLARTTSDYVVVPWNGPGSVIVTGSPRALVRVAGVAAVGPPRPQPVPLPPQPLVLQGAEQARASLGEPDVSRVGWPGEPGPFASSGYGRGVAGGVVDFDRDVSQDYLEIGVVARRGALAERLRLETGLFERLRQGPDSTGVSVELSADFSDQLSNGLGLSTQSRTRIVTQRTDAGQATGVLSSFAVVGRAPLDRDWSLVPMVSLIGRSPDDTVTRSAGTDPDVSSAYGRERPRSLDMAVYAGHRAAVDGTFRYGLQVRLTPDLDGLDAAGASAAWHVLPGSGLMPYFQVEVATSLRPASPVRERGYLRSALSPSLTMWRWLDPNQRVSLDLSGTYYRDVPVLFGVADGFSAIVQLTYDFGWGRGMDDYAPAERPFQQRLEEGSGRTLWTTPAGDPRWESVP